MPASLPGSTLAQNLANPSAGLNINHDLLSGPKGSPFDKDQAGNASTGALSHRHRLRLAPDLRPDRARVASRPQASATTTPLA